MCVCICKHIEKFQIRLIDGVLDVLKNTIIYRNKALERMTGVQYNQGSLLFSEANE